MFTYLEANPIAGYSGYVIYNNRGAGPISQISVWMVPGTFFDDWDNR